MISLGGWHFAGHHIQAEQADPGALWKDIPPEGRSLKDTRGRVPGDPAKAIDQLKRLGEMIRVHRDSHAGELPGGMGALLQSVVEDPKSYGFATALDVNPALLSEDCRFQPALPETCIPFLVFNRRRDGTPVGSPKPNGTRDLWAYTDLYRHVNTRFFAKGSTVNPVGFYLVLWDNGEVERVPYDDILYVPRRPDGTDWAVAFRGASGVPSDCITFDEFQTKVARMAAPFRGKPVPQGETVALPDNGGPEALVSLSRLLGAPIEREKLWELLDPAKEVFSLKDIRETATQFRLSLREERIGLDELERRGRPAILRLGNPDRLIVLATLGTNRALIYDKGWLQFVPRSMVAERYVGQTLLPTPAEAAASLRVERPLREVELKSFQDTASETFTITNVGSKPLQLWTESPACGCTSVELSPADLPPNATSVLRATIRPRGAGTPRWATQLTTITIHTNDPAAPRMMVGVELHVQVPKPQ